MEEQYTVDEHISSDLVYLPENLRVCVEEK